MPKYPIDSDGRLVGSIIALQTMLAQVIAEMPNPEKLLSKVSDIAGGIDDEAARATRDGDVDQFMFFSAMSAGITDTVAAITDGVKAIQNRRS